MGDVLTGVRARAALAARRTPHRERPQALQPVGDEPRHLGREHGQERAEVGRVPGPGQVGLTEADQGAVAEPGEELLGSLHGHLGPTAADRAALQMDGHRQSAYAGLEQPACDVRTRRCARGPLGTWPRSGHWSIAGRLTRVVIGRSSRVSQAGLGLGVGLGVELGVVPWGTGLHGQPAQPQRDAVGPDQRRPAQCGGCGSPWRGRGTPSGQRGAERRPVVGVQVHGHEQVVARHRHVHVVPAVGAVERRDVEPLVDPRPAVLVGMDDVGVSAAVGVVHLDDDSGQRPRAVEAPEDADRVEAVAERAGVGRHQHASVGQVDVVLGQERVDVLTQRQIRPSPRGREPRRCPGGRGRAGGRGRPARSGRGARSSW